MYNISQTWMQSKKGDLFLIVGFLVFRLFLDISYEKFLYVIYYFDTPINFLYDVDLTRYLCSLLMFVLFTTVLSSRPRDVSNVFLVMATFFLIGPLTSEFGLNAARPIEPVIYTMSALLLVDLVSRMPIPDFISRIPVPKGPLLAVAISAVAVLYLFAWAYFSGALAYFNLDVRKIYTFRDNVAALLDVGALSYLNLWVYKVFTIFLICVCLLNRKFVWLGLLLIAQFFFFGLTSHRIVLFLPFLAIAVWFYLERFEHLTPMPYAAAVGILVALLLFEVRDIESVAEIAIRRAFFVPSGMTFQWFDFFTFHPHVYWADKVLASFSSGEYVGVNIPRLLGGYFVPGADSASNMGLVPAGYAQAGIWGVLLYSVILGLVLSVLNTIVRSGAPLWFVSAMTIGPLRTALADSDLFTTLLSHGLGMAVILLWLYRTRFVAPGVSKQIVPAGNREQE
ncbi:hypothetical protein [Rhizobium sp. BE258]|uniref:hypothetical protein n=1 Tax=Rhizobium sp. BE258 TaxID=2817722 RepID=UPI00286568EF|nr:hypothetical protein [Rhizobium sp. BE258]MDR7142214.1 hypothetical protein [Rhizobium sp. BE258]